MALRIQPVLVTRPLFRRLVRENGAASPYQNDHFLYEGDSEIIRVPENLRYPPTRMSAEDMAVLLDTTIVPAQPDSETPYEDTQPAINQYASELIGTGNVQSATGSVISQQA
jgi:hypothetical protein